MRPRTCRTVRQHWSSFGRTTCTAGSTDPRLDMARFLCSQHRTRLSLRWCTREEPQRSRATRASPWRASWVNHTRRGFAGSVPPVRVQARGAVLDLLVRAHAVNASAERTIRYETVDVTQARRLAPFGKGLASLRFCARAAVTSGRRRIGQTSARNMENARRDSRRRVQSRDLHKNASCRGLYGTTLPDQYCTENPERWAIHLTITRKPLSFSEM
jgi:hypothetical protein